jgi:hypothetical protein
MDPDAIDRVVRKFATEIWLDRDYSAHSMRATFVTTALENGAQLEDVQKAAARARPNSMIGEATIRRRRHHFFCDILDYTGIHHATRSCRPINA